MPGLTLPWLSRLLGLSLPPLPKTPRRPSAPSAAELRYEAARAAADAMITRADGASARYFPIADYVRQPSNERCDDD